MKELTRAEEEVMMILWDLKKGFVKDILSEMGPDKPAYNTVSTIVRILEQKGFVAHESFGKSHRYYPLISREAYSQFAVKKVVSGYFNGSIKDLVSFFVKKETLTARELDELIKTIEKSKDNE